jgi:peptidylprolyl isomerase
MFEQDLKITNHALLHMKKSIVIQKTTPKDKNSLFSVPQKSTKANQKIFKVFIIALIVIALAFAGYNMVKKSEKTKVLLETNYGNITIELRSDMPITAGNFKSLVEKGTYNGVIFHRIIPNFMIQGGDPTGTGYGDPSIPKIMDEFNGEQKNNRGTIAMANAGPNTGSSQFFINLVNNNFLDGKHPVFGNVIEGMDIVDKIAAVETDSNDKPLKPVVIISAKVL